MKTIEERASDVWDEIELEGASPRSAITAALRRLAADAYEDAAEVCDKCREALDHRRREVCGE